MIFFVLGAALAATPDSNVHSHDLDSIGVEGVFHQFEQFFEPEGLPPSERLQEQHWHCGTGLVLEIQKHWDQFSEAQQLRFERHMSQPLPWATHPPVSDPRPGMPAPTETCFDAYPSQRPSWAGDGENRIVTEHFNREFCVKLL